MTPDEAVKVLREVDASPPAWPLFTKALDVLTARIEESKREKAEYGRALAAAQTALLGPDAPDHEIRQAWGEADTLRERVAELESALRDTAEIADAGDAELFEDYRERLASIERIARTALNQGASVRKAAFVDPIGEVTSPIFEIAFEDGTNIDEIVFKPSTKMIVAAVRVWLADDVYIDAPLTTGVRVFDPGDTATLERRALNQGDNTGEMEPQGEDSIYGPPPNFANQGDNTWAGHGPDSLAREAE